jgi:ATP-dependent Clp protease ATP-binding subunit ClpC
LEEREMTIEVTEAAKQQLIKIGYDPALGARPLRRAVQREIEDRLSEKIMRGELSNSAHIVVDAASDEFVFDTKQNVAASI